MKESNKVLIALLISAVIIYFLNDYLEGNNINLGKEIVKLIFG